MSFIDDSIKRLREEEEERRKREQAAQLIRGPQSSSTSNSSNSSTSSRNSSQTSQGGSQSPSAVDKLFHSTARKYSNATANDPTRRNSRGQAVSGRDRTRSAVNSPNASAPKVKAKEDTGKWFGSEFMGGISRGNEAITQSVVDNAHAINKASQNPIISRLADNMLPNNAAAAIKLAGAFGDSDLMHKIRDYYAGANEEQQKKAEDLRGDSWLREKAGNITQIVSEQLPMLLYSTVGGVGNGVQAFGKKIATSLIDPKTLTTYSNYITRALLQTGSNTAENPYFWDTFLRTFGPAYEEEKGTGASDLQAMVSAATNAYAQSEIEIGSGFETSELKNGFLNNLKEVIKSSGEEGAEEIEQEIVDKLTRKALGTGKARGAFGAPFNINWTSMNSEEARNAKNIGEWLEAQRGMPAVFNPATLLEQGAYGALAGGLMTGSKLAGTDVVNSIRNDNYRNAHPDFEEHAKDLIQRASVQGREGEMSTRAQNLAEEVSDQMARGKAPTTYQMRELESAVATDEYYNQKAYENSSQERYNQAVEEGKADTVKQTGTADEYYGFRRGLTETEQRNYERAKAVMGEDASERSVAAVGRFMTGSESNSDIDTILLDPEAKSAVEELTDVTLPINNVKARAELENLALVNQIANRDRILEETHNEIRTNMSRRGGELFDQNYDEAVATIDEPNAADIYENFFSRFYTAGTVEDADFEKTYNRIISPLVEDFGEELGTKISQVFSHDFAQKVFAEGQIAMNSVRAKAQGRSLSVKASENPAGFTYEEEARKHISDREANLFTKLAERAKVHIRLVSSIAGGKANGSYDPETGVILIAADSDNKFITVFKHEMTHHLKNTSPELYQKLEDFVFKKWYDGDPEKMEERVQEYQRRYNMRPDQAREEIIADASEAFFTDQGAINDAVTFNEKMARAIHDGIKSLLDTFLDLVDTDRRADKGYGDFLKDLDILKDTEKMWLEALNESVGRSKAQAETESKAKGEVKHSLKDSDGNTLSKGQQEYFKDSKARDENGNLLVLYHGTENAGFTIFDSEAGISSPAFFFTNNLEIAKGYSGTHDIARMPSFKSVEAVQKAIKNDMDADIEIRKEDGKYVMYEDGDYVDESRNINDLYNLYNQYSGFGGTSSNYKVYLNVTNPLIVDAKGKSWDDITTDFSDEPMTSNAIAEYAKENGYNGVIIRNVVDAGLYNSSGEYKTGTDVIAFNPEQIKDIDNKNPTKDPDIRFSMKTPVEETRKMIAWHNINSSNIDGVLELGGLAMPSFAIKPSDIGHGTYGDISIIASKDSIDPKVSKSQMIFGGDAWTPMFPDVSIKASEKVAKRIDERLKGILGIKHSNELPGNLRYPAIDTNNLQDQLQRWGDPYNAYGKNTVLRLAYVMNGLGKQYSLPMKEGNIGGYDKAFWELVDDRLPDKSLQEFINEDVMQYEPILRDIMYETYGKAFDDKIKGKKMKLSNPYKKELSWGKVDSIIYDLNTYRKAGIKPDVDTVALENDLDNIIQENEDGYKRWIDELFDGVIEKKGVRNNKDMFTPSGSRRSWESLHDDYNLANIVKAMKGQSKQGNNSMFTTVGNVKGAALKSYSDIEDVRRDLGRIAPEESEEIKSKYDQFTEDTKVLANRIADDPFSGSEMLADILSHAKTEASIYRFLNREYDFLRTQNHLDLKALATDIYNLGQLANTLPMEYFESKIYRAYPLQEALAIVVPDNLDSKTVDRIKEYNGNILTYKAGNEEDRLAKVNSVEGAKFSLKKDPDQLDFFDMLKSKGVDDENARIGSEALADTGKLKSKSKAKKKKNPYNTLAVSFYEKMIQDGSATLVGHKFKNKHDLAQALQMYRDPRYETCRLFFLDKNNKIVMQTGVTQRLPSMSAIFAGTTNEENERYISNVLNSATKRGAVAFYTSHNHPSGNPEPSRDDYDVNRRFKSLADQSNGKLKYRGQIVIDHNTYAYISPGKAPSNFGEGADIYSMYSAKKAEDPLHKTDDESKRMGMNQQLRNQNAIADLLMSLNVPEDHATLLYLSTQLRGKAIQSMDLGHFAESDSYHIRQELIKNAKDFGAYAVALGMNETNDARTRLILEDLYENGSLLDVFIYDKNNGYTNFDADDSKQRGWGSLWDEEARNAPEQVGEQIKFSLKSGGESRNYQSTITKLENQVKDLKAEFKRTDLKTADPKDVRIQAGKLIKRHDSNMSVQGELVDTFNRIFKLYKENGTESFDDIYNIAKNAAVEVVNNISIVHDEGAEDYKAIKEYLKETPIVITEDMKKNITDFNDFRKRYFGKLKLVNGDTGNIDNVYMELNEMFPGQFTEDYVNPADQLYHMADVLDNYAPYYETLDGASPEMQDYVVDIAADIMETAYGLQTKKTFADKKYEEKVKAVAEARQKALESRDNALNRQKQRYEEKLEFMKNHNKEMRDKARARREASEERAKQERRAQREARREKKKDSDARTRLLEVARRISRIKSTEQFEEIRDALIGQLDLEAKSMTGKTRMKLEDLQRWYEDQVENNDWFVRNEKLEEKFKRLNKTHIAGMGIEDVQNLTEILLMLEHKVRNDKKLINSQYQHDVFMAALETSKGIKQAKGLRAFGLHKLDDIFIGQSLSPMRYMRRLTGYDENNPLMIATKELQDGEIKTLDYRMNALKPFNRFADLKFVSYLNGRKAPLIKVNATTIDMKPTTVEIIPSIRIWFYLSSLNEDNMRHIVNGGVHIPDAKLLKAGKRTDAYDRGRLVRFSKSQVQAIINGMTAEEKAYADQVYNYFNNVAPKATNEVSEQLDGISVAKVKNYLRISVDKDFLDVDADIIKRDGTLEGMGSHKERVKSTKPVYAEDISDVLMRAIEADSKYVGMAIPIRNFNKIYHSSSMEAARGEAEHKQLTGTVDNSPVPTNGMPSVVGDEQSPSYRTLTGGYVSVQEAIKSQWSSDATEYIDKFISDLQFSHQSAGVVEKGLRKLTSNYAAAVLTLNASVAIKQAASFPTAAAVVGWKPLIKSMGRLGKLDLDYVDSVTPLLNYRTEGFNFRETGDIQNRGNREGFFQRATRSKALNWIQGMDVLTTRKLFKAAQIYVEDNFKLRQGTEAYDKKVAEIYNRIITETQPNYTTMERPGHLRSDSTLERTLSMFKTQPYQNFNIWYDATGNYLAKRARFKDSRNEENRKALKEASKDLYNASTSQIVQLAVFAAMSSLWALFRRKDDKYRDEEGNITFASYMKQIAKDMLSGAASEIFLGSEVFSAIDSKVNGTYYRGFSSVTDSAINDVINSMRDFIDLAGDAFEHFTKGEEAETTTKDLLKQMKKVGSEMGRFTGIPTGNIMNLINATYNWVAISANGKYVGTYEAQKMALEKQSEMMDNLFQAYRHDKGAYEQIRKMMIEDGIKEDSIDTSMKKKMKEHKSDTEQKKYDSSMQTLEGSSIWKGASADDQEYYKGIIEKMSVGIEDTSTGYVTNMMKSGLTEEQVILYKLALKKVDKPSASGKYGSYTKEEREAAIKLLEKEFSLTYAQKETLKG